MSREAEAGSLIGPTCEHSHRSLPDLGQCRTPGRRGEVAKEEEVDDVAGSIVDRARRLVRVGDGVELLRDLEAHRDPDEGVRIGETEAAQRRWLDRLLLGPHAGLVGRHLKLDASPGHTAELKDATPSESASTSPG